MLCPQCSTSNLADFEFCTNCGLRFNDEKETVLIPEAETVIRQPKKRQIVNKTVINWRFIVLCVLAVILAGGVVVMINLIENRLTTSKNQNVSNQMPRQIQTPIDTVSNSPQQQTPQAPGNAPKNPVNAAANAAGNAVNRAWESAEEAARRANSAVNDFGYSPNIASNNAAMTRNCRISNNGNTVNLRMYCDFRNCNSDNSTIYGEIKDGTPIGTTSTIINSGGRIWRKVVYNGDYYFVAESKIYCN